MLLAFVGTLAVTPNPQNNFPFSSAEEFLRFKATAQKQLMQCMWETEESENWVRYRPACYFGGYRPNGPQTDL
jgi:hypothetical protein